MTEAMTREDKPSRVMVNPVQARRQSGSEVRLTMLVRDADRKRVEKRLNSYRREKLLGSLEVPVPQTDTGGRGENPKTIGRTLVKELGKMAP
jgi:hypothetical protein